MTDPLRDPTPEEARAFWAAYCNPPRRYATQDQAIMHALATFVRERRIERVLQEEADRVHRTREAKG